MEMILLVIVKFSVGIVIKIPGVLAEHSQVHFLLELLLILIIER